MRKNCLQYPANENSSCDTSESSLQKRNCVSCHVNYSIWFDFTYLFLGVLGMKPRTSHTLGKHCTLNCTTGPLRCFNAMILRQTWWYWKGPVCPDRQSNTNPGVCSQWLLVLCLRTHCWSSVHLGHCHKRNNFWLFSLPLNHPCSPQQTAQTFFTLHLYFKLGLSWGGWYLRRYQKRVPCSD
jgi:hypothetical protein